MGGLLSVNLADNSPPLVYVVLHHRTWPGQIIIFIDMYIWSWPPNAGLGWKPPPGGCCGWPDEWPMICGWCRCGGREKPDGRPKLLKLNSGGKKLPGPLAGPLTTADLVGGIRSWGAARGVGGKAADASVMSGFMRPPVTPPPAIERMLQRRPNIISQCTAISHNVALYTTSIFSFFFT